MRPCSLGDGRSESEGKSLRPSGAEVPSPWNTAEKAVRYVFLPRDGSLLRTAVRRGGWNVDRSSGQGRERDRVWHPDRGRGVASGRHFLAPGSPRPQPRRYGGRPATNSQAAGRVVSDRTRAHPRSTSRLPDLVERIWEKVRMHAVSDLPVIVRHNRKCVREW